MASAQSTATKLVLTGQSIVAISAVTPKSNARNGEFVTHPPRAACSYQAISSGAGEIGGRCCQLAAADSQLARPLTSKLGLSIRGSTVAWHDAPRGINNFRKFSPRRFNIVCSPVDFNHFILTSLVMTFGEI
jgi:hypothetical protein